MLSSNPLKPAYEMMVFEDLADGSQVCTYDDGAHRHFSPSGTHIAGSDPYWGSYIINRNVAYAGDTFPIAIHFRTVGKWDLHFYYDLDNNFIAGRGSNATGDFRIVQLDESRYQFRYESGDVEEINSFIESEADELSLSLKMGDAGPSTPRSTHFECIGGAGEGSGH